MSSIIWLHEDTYELENSLTYNIRQQILYNILAYPIKQGYYTRILDYILMKTRFSVSAEMDVLVHSEWDLLTQVVTPQKLQANGGGQKTQV